MNKADKGQLIFVSHSTNLLSNSILQPNQIYSVDFDKEGSIIKRFSSEKPREAQNLEKMYLGGVKIYAHNQNFNHQKISEDTLLFAVNELLYALKIIEQKEFDIDAFKFTSRNVFDYEEEKYQEINRYSLLSLMVIALLDLGLIELEEST